MYSIIRGAIGFIASWQFWNSWGNTTDMMAEYK